MTSPAGAPPSGAPLTRALSRRGLPAVLFLLALCLLTALVWWRVINRDDSKRHAVSATCTPSAAPKTTTLPSPTQVTVEVYNSTARTGLGAAVAKALKADGFLVPNAATNDPHNKLITGVAEIRYGTPGAAAATLLGYYLPGAAMVTTTEADSTVAVSLGAKYTALATPAAVTTALAKAGVTLAKPSSTPTPASTC